MTRMIVLALALSGVAAAACSAGGALGGAPAAASADLPDAIAVSDALDSLGYAEHVRVLAVMNGDLPRLQAASASRSAAMDVLARAVLAPVVMRQLPWPRRIAWMNVALSERRDDWCQGLLEGLGGTPPPPGSPSRGDGALAMALCAERLLDRDPEEGAGYLNGDPETPLSEVADRALRAAAAEDFLLRDEAFYRLWRQADRDGDSTAALAWADSLVTLSPRSLRIPSVRITRARAALDAGRYADAVEEGRRALPDADAADLRWVITQGLLGLDRPHDAAVELEQLLALFPQDPLAVTAWKEREELAARDTSLALDPQGWIRLAGGLLDNPLLGMEKKLRHVAGNRHVPRDRRRQAALVLGRYDYRAKRYGDLPRLLAPWEKDRNTDDAQECRLILARGFRNTGRVVPMTKEYRALIDANGTRASLACWELAREYESQGRWGGADSVYSELLQRFPDSPRAADAYFRRGFARTREEKGKAAAEDFRAAFRATRDPRDEERAAFWLARTLQEMGDEAGARSAAMAAATTPEPADGYGVLLRERFLADRSDADSAGVRIGGGDVEDILDSTVWPDQITRYVQRGIALARLGVVDEARREWRQAVDLGDSYPTLVQAAAVLAAGASVYPEGVQWARRVADQLPLGHPLRRPFTRLAFPAAYYGTVMRETAKRGIDPRILWAVMRQESLYDPRAVSRAGALGLLQVMPATLAELPPEGDSPIPTEALLTPRTNIAVGTRWFAQRIEDFDGMLFPALASYNAGVTKCREWIERAGGDADVVFLECIGYPETYDYVKRIIRLQWMYGACYRGDIPSTGASGN